MNYIIKHLKTLGIGYTLIFLLLPGLYARSAVAMGVPINTLDEGAAVKDWVILGPFPNEMMEKPETPDGATRGGFHHDYLTDLGGETKPVWKRVKQVSYKVDKGNTTTVSPQLIDTNWTGQVNMINYYPKSTYKVGYAFCRVRSDEKQTVYCHIGSNDGVRVWVNGELVHSLWQERRGLMPWEDRFEITLDKGLNSILLKSDQAVHAWGFAVELFTTKPASKRVVQVPEGLHYNTADLSKMRGKGEIAYRSEIDGTLQPMMIYIPPDYDANKTWPLYIDLHGSGESYLISKIGDPNIFDEDALQIAVWGRGPRSGFNGLSEVDVLEAIDYVTKNWNIDENRIHLGGNSMGGGGTFSLIARFPDKFSSGRIWAGYNEDLPLGNMKNVPLYLLHSDDDFLVPMSNSRNAMQRLSQLGAKVTWDETHGDGHAVMGNTEASIRSLHWVKRQTRSSQVRNIHFTAMDGLSHGAWWASILEWGPKRSYPSFKLSLGNDNTLYLNFDNVGALTLNIASSPIDQNKPLMIVIEGQQIGTVQSPLPNKLFIYRKNNKWIVDPHSPKLPKERLHFPGGATALYHGEPLMVVWGTNGGDEVNEKIRDLAQLARATPNPNWTDQYDRQMQYSLLPGKPDTDVTEGDISRYNLILIGTAVQNSIVARLANDLPVSLTNGKIASSDEVSWNFTDRGLGLLYYNPLNPKRLIYWLASNEKDFYRSGLPLLRHQGWAVGAEDFQLFNAHKNQRVAGRNFNSRWSWEAGYRQSPKLSDNLCSLEGFDIAMKKAIQMGTGADYVLDSVNDNEFLPSWAAGETRLMDVMAYSDAYTSRLGVINLSGVEITKQQEYFKEQKRRQKLKFFFGPESDQIDPDRIYTIGIPFWTMWDYTQSTKTNPESFRVLESNFSDLLERQLIRSMGDTN